MGRIAFSFFVSPPTLRGFPSPLDFILYIFRAYTYKPVIKSIFALIYISLYNFNFLAQVPIYRIS